MKFDSNVLRALPRGLCIPTFGKKLQQDRTFFPVQLLWLRLLLDSSLGEPSLKTVGQQKSLSECPRKGKSSRLLKSLRGHGVNARNYCVRTGPPGGAGPSPLAWTAEAAVATWVVETLQSLPMPVTVRSFAKINLGLRIGAAREDGFHELLTVYQTIGLHDVIRVSVARGAGIEIRCADPRVPRDESNTCFRIVEKALRVLQAKSRVIVEIEKRLPVQGGLGGASANAVAALLALERALKKRVRATDGLGMGAEGGADLRLWVGGGRVPGVGRGEQV